MSFDGLVDGSRDGSGNLVSGDSGPLDTICSKVEELLATDSTVSCLFHAIDSWDRRVLVFGGLPRLHIFPGTFDRVRGPTSLEVGEVEVVISMIEEAGTTRPRELWAVGWSGIMRAVQNVLRANTQLADQVDGVSKPLAYSSRPGPETIFGPEAEDGRRAIHRDFGWIYRIKIDDTTGTLEAFS